MTMRKVRNLARRKARILRITVLPLIMGIGTASLAAQAAPDSPLTLIHGRDNRVEVTTLAGARKRNADATVALIRASDIVDNGDGTSRLLSRPLGKAYDLCPDQRFRSQPTAGACSGVLVRRNVVVTAAHCIFDRSYLAKTRFVFGYRVGDGQSGRTIANSEIYRGVKLLADQPRGDDVTVILLDRAVHNHEVAPIQAASVSLHTPVYIIGHPSGLPAKFAGDAKVLENGSPSLFATNLDVFDGNSGSPVFNARNDKLVGILSEGALVGDYRPRGSCNVVNVLPDTQAAGKSVRTTRVIPFLPPEIGVAAAQATTLRDTTSSARPSSERPRH